MTIAATRTWGYQSKLISENVKLNEFHQNRIAELRFQIWRKVNLAGRVNNAALRSAAVPYLTCRCHPILLLFHLGNLGDLYTVSGQTLQGSFSAGSKQIFASKYAFLSIFRNLQENHLLASKFYKFLLKICKNLQKFLTFFGKFRKILQNFQKIVKILAKISKFLAEISRICSREGDFLGDFEKC